MLDMADSISILIADDDPDVNKFLKMILKKFSSNIIAVSNGKEVIDKLKNSEILIAFLDINLPGMSGIEILGEAKKLKLNTVFIMFTGDEDPKVIKKCLKLGAYDYLEKPCQRSDFENTAMRAIEFASIQKERRDLLELLVCEYGNTTIENFRAQSPEMQKKTLEIVQSLLRLKISNRL